MNVFFTIEAQAAWKNANEKNRARALSLLASYAGFFNAHTQKGKNTLKNVSKSAREALGLPPGTRVFETAETGRKSAN